MNMSFACPVPAQVMAANYANAFAKTFEGPLTCAGHSKGGNLAVFAAAFCKPETQERVKAVYNFDGPGFDDMVLVTPMYQKIAGLIHTYIPQSSLVGVLLGHEESSQVIHSRENNLLEQHNMYTWEVLRDGLVPEEGTTGISRYFDRTMREWLGNMEKDQRERFVDACYSLVVALEIRTTTDFKKHWLGKSVGMLQQLGKLEPETKKDIQEGLALLARSAKDSAKNKGL